MKTHPAMGKMRLILLLILILALLALSLPALSVYAAPLEQANTEAVAEAASANQTYVVVRGDTLSHIARRYGTSVSAIKQANNLRSDTIRIGQRLIIPRAQPGPGPVYPITHVVQRGDTLAKLAARYGTTVAALMRVNNLRSDRIYVGQRLKISVAADPNSPLLYHTVRRGDTLAALSRRYNVSIAAIKSSNGLTGDRIYVGQRLLIPQRLGYPTATPIPGPTQPARERIQFAPGATSTTVTGKVTDPVHREYVLRAQGGQTIHMELVSDDALANFSVRGLGDGQVLKNFGDTVWTGVLPTSQDYLITILTLEYSSTNYSLFVGVSPLPPTGTIERIQFAPGAISATVSGSPSAIEPKRYVLGARGGQTMTVSLSVDNANVYITVLNPSGENMAGADGPIHNWAGTLPVNGDYMIEVLNPGTGLANFNLIVTIQ